MGAQKHCRHLPRLDNRPGHHFTPFFPTFNPKHPLALPHPPRWIWGENGIKKPPGLGGE